MNRKMNLSPFPWPFRRLFRNSGRGPGVSRPLILGWPVVLALALLFAPLSAFAQKKTSQTTSIHGTVTAQNGAVLAGATVQLVRNASANSTSISADTDEMGHYEFQNLEPGEYALSVTGNGFRKTEITVLLRAGDQKIEDFSLPLAGVSETVEVTGSEPVISTESASAPVAVVTNPQLVTLPTAQEKIKEVIPVTPG